MGIPKQSADVIGLSLQLLRGLDSWVEGWHRTIFG